MLDRLEAAVRRGFCEAAAGFGVALVATAGDRQQRKVEAGQVVPYRLEHALSRGPEQPRQVLRRVGEPAGALRLDQLLRLVREERLALPNAHDLLDARALHPRRELLVRLRAL